MNNNINKWLITYIEKFNKNNRKINIQYYNNIKWILII